MFPASPTTNYNIIITGVNFDSSDNACGLNGATGTGLNASTNQSVPITYSISGANNSADTGTLACNITSVTTSTPGFSVSGANVPLTIPANSSQLLGFNLITPADPYTGILTFDIT